MRKKRAAERDKRAYRFCRKELSAAEAAQYEAEGASLRAKLEVLLGRTLRLQDLIKGEDEFVTDEIGDFVIVRPDGTALYNFSSVVDDAVMQITHVVRADEHLSNTFPQLLLFEALGSKLPAFAHIPFVAEPGSKAKMSKRKIAEYEKLGILVYIHQYIEKGYLPDGLMNYLSRLGWSFDGTQEIFTRPELIEKFSLERVNSSPASHDQDKLFWIEGEWMKTFPLEKKVEGVLPYLKQGGLGCRTPFEPDRSRIEAVITALGDRLKVFSDILKMGRFFFTESLTFDPDAVKKRLRKEGVPAMLAELDQELAAAEPFDLATLEKTIHAGMPSGPAARWAMWSTPSVWPITGRDRPRPVRPPGHPGPRRLPGSGSGRRWNTRVAFFT